MSTMSMSQEEISKHPMELRRAVARNKHQVQLLFRGVPYGVVVPHEQYEALQERIAQLEEQLHARKTGCA